MAFNVKRALRSVYEWVRPDPPGVRPLTVEHAMSLTQRNRVSDLFTYRDFDADEKLMYLDDGHTPAVGFVLAINPLMVAGLDAEAQIEAVFNACPTDTVVQFSVLVTPQVEGYLNVWAQARLEKNQNPLLRQIAERRHDFMLTTATGPSMLPNSRLHPRMSQHYCSVRVPYKGAIGDPKELMAFRKHVLELRSTIQGALKATFIESDVLDESDVKFLLRELLNPHLDPTERLFTAAPGVPAHRDLVDRNTRMTVTGEGGIGFSGEDGPPEVVVTPITMDATPRVLTLPMMAATLGNPSAWDERITCPYWAYTTIHVLDADKAKDSLTTKLGLLNRQTMSESAWYRSMMGEMFERRDMVNQLLGETRKGHRLVRAYAGVNLYTPPEDMRQQTEYVKGLWRRVGFRVSEEKYIGLPVFVASMPLQYTPAMDPPQRGMQRASLMHSLNAASLVPVQGDWRGTPPSKGGPLFVSRRGQLASFDLLQTTINYNFVIIAASGSGKSFLANELVADFLSKGGIARIIDVGRSYHRFCEIIGGQNVVFAPESPVSLNPFSGLEQRVQLDEMMAMLKDLLRQMAFPLTPDEDTPAWEYAALEKAVSEAWNRHRGETELRHVYEWLLEHNDEQGRARDLAFQLEPYAVGRYARWFSGPRTVRFDNPFVVVELEELKQDPQLQAAVLTLVIHQVTKEMYLADRKIPKLLAIDEAWDLMGGLKTGKFIETAFRRARKYNAIAGVITQSYQDFAKSAAAKAAIDNAAWQFILYQRPESLEFAKSNGHLVGGEGELELMKTVRSGQGFSEIYVRGENGAGLYRFVTDKHSYYTFTTKPADINRINDLVAQGLSMAEAVDRLAREDYRQMWGEAYG